MAIEAPLVLAVITAVSSCVVLAAVAENTTLVMLLGTTAFDGIVNAVILLESAMVTPAIPAGCDRVILHFDVAPEARLDGVHEKELKSGELEFVVRIVMEAVRDTSFICAVMVTTWVAETVPTVATSAALEAPGGTVTDEGIVNALELADISTLTAVVAG